MNVDFFIVISIGIRSYQILSDRIIT